MRTARRPELIISCGKCAGGAGAGRERGGPRRRRRGAASRRRAGSAEPRALRRRRDPAFARPVSRGPGRAVGGLGSRGPPGPPFRVPRPGPPCPQDPRPCPDPLRGAGKAGPGRSSPAWSPAAPLRRSAGAQDLAHSTAWGGTSPGVAAASGPPFRSLWPGRAGTDLGTSCPSGPPPPLAEIPPHPPGIP